MTKNNANINKQINCKYCGNKATKFSKVPTVKSGKKQRYRCTECGKTFYGGDE
jgi:transposase-like protein